MAQTEPQFPKTGYQCSDEKTREIVCRLSSTEDLRVL